MPSSFRVVMLVALFAAACPGEVRAADAPVVAVVAVDGYADLKKQIGWVGARVGNPQLAALAESFVMMATQFKGLAGLDVNRSAGVVVTANGDQPVVHGYVPVKDLDKLLGALQGVTGPVDQVGGKRVVTLPTGMRLEIEEQDGWAVVTPQGSPAGPGQAAALIADVAETYSLGAKLFPSALPEGMREQLKAGLEQASAAAAAAQGERPDPDGQQLLAVLNDIANADVESIVIGLAVDLPQERIFVESRSVMLPGSAAAAVWSDAGKTANALGLPAAADGKPAAIRGHHAQAVPPAARPAIEATLAQALPTGGGDPITDALFGLVQDLVGAMLDAGGLEAGLAIDTTGVKAGALVPAVTLAANVKDGPALEQQVKRRFGAEGSLPPEAKITFDAGTAAGANLHELTIDISALPAAAQFGDRLEATLAVTADRAYLLVGGDVAKRLEAAVAAGKAADPESKPLTGLDLSVPDVMAYVAELAAASGDQAAGDLLSEVATDSAAKPTAGVSMLVQPIERGVALRVSADAGAIETIAAAITAQVTPVPAGGGLPPLPAGAGAPALAP